MRVPGYTTTVTIGGERFSITANGEAALGEVFIRWGKQGTSASGLIDAFAAALSIGLRHGVPLADLIEPGLGMWHAPNGRTDDPEIPRARSLIDYVSRRLAIDWLPAEERATLGVFTLSERVEQAAEWIESGSGPANQVAGPLPRAASGAGVGAAHHLQNVGPSLPA